MTRVLRLGGGSNLQSADIFERQFLQGLAGELDFVRVEMAAWFESLLGAPTQPISLSKAASRFLSATEHFDFVCPDYRGNLLSPLLLWLRNRACSKVRLLFIAHAPGAYLLEWVLMAPLLAPGDLIVAPSTSAASLIRFLCPELNVHVRVIPHPIQRLPRTSDAQPEYIASLSRIVPEKLIHRQIEAMAILRDRGVRMKMMIAGPLNEPGGTEPREYAKTLLAKTQRLNLGQSVEFVGEIRGDAAKGDFLSRAHLLLNLSITTEESFGKSIAEALGMGVPVLATQWDGFDELIGRAGSLIRVRDHGSSLDVGADQIADAVEQMLHAPPGRNDCIERTARCLPAKVAGEYRQHLEEALTIAADRPLPVSMASRATAAAAPTEGLLAHTAPLESFSWQELFDIHVADAGGLLRRFKGEDVRGTLVADRLRSILMAATQAVVGRFLAHLDYADLATPVGKHKNRTPFRGSFEDRLIHSAGSKAIPRSILTCLLSLSDGRCWDRVPSIVAQLDLESCRSPGLSAYLEADGYRQSGNFRAALHHAVSSACSELESEFGGYRLQQIGRIAREWDQPALALPWLRDWLGAFPDSPNSGAVWREYCLNAYLAGPDFIDEGRYALRRARALSTASPMIDEVERRLSEANFPDVP